MRIVWGMLSFSLLLAGCDAEGPTDRDDAAAVDPDPTTEGEDADETDDGDDSGPDDRPGLHVTARPSDSQGRRPSGLHPCGNGSIDDGEQCDDGLANGNDRECTHACTLNDCELDEHGVCEDHSPVADVDLHPCTFGGSDDRCRGRVVTP